ncbi:MAG TPA: radical SAM protein [Methanothrix sp.]|nr:radical SAM protein [Methanothrix sp.]
MKFPILVYFEVTYQCNNNCSHCYNKYLTDKSLKSDLTNKKNALRDIKKTGTKIINYTGGEPTLFNELIELINYGKHLGFYQTINTNARRITKSYAIRLKNAGISRARVSLCGSNSNLHETQTRTEGSWKETLAGISALLDSEIDVTVNLTLTKKNYLDLKNTARLSKSIGADFSISRFVPTSESSESLSCQLERDNLEYILYCIKELKTEGIDINLSAPIPFCSVNNCYKDLLKPCQCAAGILTCVVSPGLSVRACPMDDIILGDLINNRLSDLWISEKMKAFCDAKSYHENCTNCPLFPLCRGGCKQAAKRGGVSQMDPLADFENSLSIEMYLEGYIEKLDQSYPSLKKIPSIITNFSYIDEDFGATIMFEDNSYIFLIGDSSCTIWNAIDGKKNIYEISKIIEEYYSGDLNQIHSDCINFLGYLGTLQKVDFS